MTTSIKEMLSKKKSIKNRASSSDFNIKGIQHSSFQLSYCPVNRPFENLFITS